MKKLLMLTLVVVVVLAGCTNKIPDSKNGKKYVEFYYYTIEKASPGFTGKVNDVTKALKIDDDIKSLNKLIEDTITQILEPVPDDDAYLVFNGYKIGVENIVDTINFDKGKENMDKVIIDAKTNIEQAKVDYFNSLFMYFFEFLLPSE